MVSASAFQVDDPSSSLGTYTNVHISLSGFGRLVFNRTILTV